MKLSKIFFFLILSVLVVFSSCKEDEISQDVVTEQPITPDEVTFNPLVANVQASTSSEESLDLGCFTIDFPFTLNVDGIEVSITNEEDFFNAIDDTAVNIDFVYPLNITYPDETTATIADGEELGEAFASCVPDGGWDGEVGNFPAYLICDLNSCYQLVYPLNLVDSEGNTYIATSEEEFIDLIAEHFDLFFEFPVNLLNEDGETVTAESDDDLFELLSSCNEIVWPNDTIDWNVGSEFLFGCYELGYPVTLVGEDGSETVVNNNDEFFSALLNGDFVTFGFPLTLIGEDGETLVVNSEEEFGEALADCGVVVEGDVFIGMLYEGATNFDMGDCYEVLYPVTVINPQDGSTLTLNSDDDLTEDVLNGFWIVEMPVSVSVDGVATSINNIEELFELLIMCE